MTRLFLKRSTNRTSLTWQDKYPTSFLYQSPVEIDRLKRVASECERSVAKEKSQQVPKAEKQS